MIFDLDMFLPFRHSTAVAPNRSRMIDAPGCIPVGGVLVLNMIDGFLFLPQVLRGNSRSLDAMTQCDEERVLIAWDFLWIGWIMCLRI